MGIVVLLCVGMKVNKVQSLPNLEFVWVLKGQYTALRWDDGLLSIKDTFTGYPNQLHVLVTFPRNTCSLAPLNGSKRQLNSFPRSSYSPKIRRIEKKPDHHPRKNECLPRESSTLEPLNSGPLNSGKPLINRQAMLD